MGSREEILEDLRAAQARRARAGKESGHAEPAAAPISPEASPAVSAANREGLVARFLERLISVKGEALRAPDAKAVWGEIEALLKRWEVRGVALREDPLVRELGLKSMLEEKQIPCEILKGEAEERAWRQELAQAALEHRAPRVAWDLAITGCEAALAETGSVAHRVAPGQGRSGWLLCQNHLVVLRAAQIVPDLEHLFAPGQALGREGLPRAITLITGPSRTADIEQTLTVGVHGPGKFCALVVG